MAYKDLGWMHGSRIGTLHLVASKSIEQVMTLPLLRTKKGRVNQLDVGALFHETPLQTKE